MKKLLWLLPFLFIVTTAFLITTTTNHAKEGIVFFEGTWAQAIEKSKKENKPIFVDFYAVWCGPCKMLKNQTFVDKTVAEYYNKNFINVTIDAEKGEGVELANKYYINAYPTLYILNTEGKPVLSYKGFLPAKEFLDFGQQGFKRASK